MYILDWVIIALVAIVSLLAVRETIKDKRAAERHGRRTSEYTLLLLGLFGGAVAEFVTMLIIRHKTRHLKFMLGLPGIILMHAMLLFIYIMWLRKSLA